MRVIYAVGNVNHPPRHYRNLREARRAFEDNEDEGIQRVDPVRALDAYAEDVARLELENLELLNALEAILSVVPDAYLKDGPAASAVALFSKMRPDVAKDFKLPGADALRG
jgi:hypothetical protein